MQRYEKEIKSNGIGKKILSDFLGFLKYKVDNDLLTLEEEQAMVNVIENDIPLFGTSEDFAKYYNQSPVNVRSVINRKLINKPIRRVFYPFSAFSRIIPERWKHHCCSQPPKE